MKGMKKFLLCLLSVIFFPLLSDACPREKTNGADSLEVYAYKKEIPPPYREPILKALSFFPELKEVHIIFRIRKQYAGLTTKPDFPSVFKRKNHRTYIITISNNTIDTLWPLLFENLTYEQRVGVIGHELSHVADFNSHNFFQTVATGIGHISARFLDKMEFNTDRICIQHGLGEYLLAYSTHVREVMHVQTWRGVDFVYKNDQRHERYMNPSTIRRYMDSLPLH